MSSSDDVLQRADVATRNIVHQEQEKMQVHKQHADTQPPAQRRLNGTRTAFFSSALCEDGHRFPLHPERFERAQVVRARITHEFPDIHHVQHITPATRQRLLLFHTPKHVDRLDAIFAKVRASHNATDTQMDNAVAIASSTAMHRIDEDTIVTHGTEDAALTAVGAACDAVDLVMSNPNIRNAFCGVRPPGHHAEPQRAMGFCLFNNVGIAASYVLDAYAADVQRVTVVDFDVHHGNGTQAKFATDPRVQYVSLHQAPCYPYTGSPNDRGAHGYSVNVLLPARTGSHAFRAAITNRVLPTMRAFRPDVVFVSAGFDAHVRDPLAELALETADYYWVTQQIVALAWEFAHGRVISVLEGGYDLEALAESAAAHVRALIEGAASPDERAVAGIDAVIELTAAFASSIAVTSTTATGAAPDPNRELRVTVHCGAKEKLLKLPMRSLSALLTQCKHKFNVKVAIAPADAAANGTTQRACKASSKTATGKALYDCHGAPLSLAMLLALPNDQHLDDAIAIAVADDVSTSTIAAITRDGGVLACPPQSHIVAASGKCECVSGYTRNRVTDVCELASESVTTSHLPSSERSRL